MCGRPRSVAVKEEIRGDRGGTANGRRQIFNRSDVNWVDLKESTRGLSARAGVFSSFQIEGKLENVPGLQTLPMRVHLFVTVGPGCAATEIRDRRKTNITPLRIGRFGRRTDSLCRIRRQKCRTSNSAVVVERFPDSFRQTPSEINARPRYCAVSYLWVKNRFIREEYTSNKRFFRGLFLLGKKLSVRHVRSKPYRPTGRLTWGDPFLSSR